MPQTAWYQQALTPPSIVELRLMVGVITEQDHVQALVEAVEQPSGIQIAQWSCPHASMAQLLPTLERAVVELYEQLKQTVEPF